MSVKSKPKKKPAKSKTGKPAKKAVTHRQQFQKELQAFEQRVNDKLEAFRQALNSAMERMWKNIQYLDNAMSTAEAHIVMLRRVMDDGLNSAVIVTETPMTIRKVVDGQETLVEGIGNLVNWGHYTSWYLKEKAKQAAAKQAAIEAAKQAPEAKEAGQPVLVNGQAAEVLEQAGAQVAEDAAATQPEPVVEAKKEEPGAPPQDDGIPEGAAVFGGD